MTLQVVQDPPVLEEIECWSNPDPVCPFCKKEYIDVWEHGLEDTQSTEVECGGCERKFKITCRIDVTYTTSPPEGWPKERT